MGRYDLVIFDCDGTLVDSETLNNQATIEILAECGLPGYTLDHAFNHWMGTTYSSIRLVVQMETGKMLPDDFVMRCMRRTAELQLKELKPVQGALDVVKALYDQGAKICVASNGERQNVVGSIRLTGLLPFFPEERIFTKSQVERPKPAPDLFLFAAETMGAEPKACVVIEDSVAGVTAGVAAGMTVIGFTGTSHDKAGAAERLTQAGAAVIVDGFVHIAGLLSN